MLDATYTDLIILGQIFIILLELLQLSFVESIWAETDLNLIYASAVMHGMSSLLRSFNLQIKFLKKYMRKMWLEIIHLMFKKHFNTFHTPSQKKTYHKIYITVTTLSERILAFNTYNH